jgi:hypothetical protein
MIPVSRVSRVLAVVVVLAWSALASGCQQKTAQDVIASVNQNLSHGKFKEAQAQGEDFLAGKEDSGGQLAWALAKACAQLGKHDLAVNYASQAIRANAVSGVELMAEPLLDPIRTDIRLVALAAGMSATAPTQATQPAQATRPVQAAPHASASVNAHGVEATAGDVSVKLPD